MIEKLDRSIARIRFKNSNPGDFFVWGKGWIMEVKFNEQFLLETKEY